jgi:hypothetical protein
MNGKAAAQQLLRQNPVKRGIYRHYKGGLYLVFACSLDEASLTELVHYYSLERQTCWTRTRADFFEPVLVDGRMFDRFVYMRRETMAEREAQELAGADIVREA